MNIFCLFVLVFIFYDKNFDFFAMQLLIFLVFAFANPLGSVPLPTLPSQQSQDRLKWVFKIIWSCDQVALAHFSRTALSGFGGLKWTRTIDLTLIRRVL